MRAAARSAAAIVARTKLRRRSKHFSFHWHFATLTSALLLSGVTVKLIKLPFFSSPSIIVRLGACNLKFTLHRHGHVVGPVHEPDGQPSDAGVAHELPPGAGRNARGALVNTSREDP